MLNHSIVYLKLIQHCILNIMELKIFKKLNKKEYHNYEAKIPYYLTWLGPPGIKSTNMKCFHMSGGRLTSPPERTMITAPSTNVKKWEVTEQLEWRKTQKLHYHWKFYSLIRRPTYHSIPSDNQRHPFVSLMIIICGLSSLLSCSGVYQSITFSN